MEIAGIRDGLDKRGHHSGEGGTHNQTNWEVDDVTADYKIFKTLKHEI